MFFRRNSISVEHTFPLHSKFAVADRYVFSFSLFLNFAFVKCFKCLLVYSFSGFVIHLNYFFGTTCSLCYYQFCTLEFCSNAVFVTVICSIECRICICL